MTKLEAAMAIGAEKLKPGARVDFSIYFEDNGPSRVVPETAEVLEVEEYSYETMLRAAEAGYRITIINKLGAKMTMNTYWVSRILEGDEANDEA